MKRRKVFEGGINNRTEKELNQSAFLQKETDIDNKTMKKNLEDKTKRSFFGVNITNKEALYLDKLKERYQLTRGGVFHIVLSEYMRNHPL